MGKLSDVFGDDFEEEYKHKENEQRERRRKVETGVLKEICWTAVEGEGFDGEEPRFSFDAGEMEYDVLLMRSPDRDLQKFRHQLGDDAMSMGMFHLDTLFSCAFQGDMVSLIEKIEEDEYYIVVGNYQEREDDGETYYNVNPVAGIVPIAQAKKYADEVDERMTGSSIEEQAQQQSEETESTSDEDEDDVDLGSLDEEDDQVSEEEVLKVLKMIGNKKKSIMNSVASGDEDALEKVTGVVDKNTDGSITEDRVAQIFHENVEPIDGYEDGEEEEDDLDLGGLDDDEDDDLLGDEDETDEVEEDTTEDESEPAESEDDEDSDVEDWF